MKNMRAALLLSILVFISTLYWPQLLDTYLMLIAFAITVILVFLPKLRILAVIPITALYFTVYANLTLTGQMLPTTQIINDKALMSFADGKDHNIVVEVISLISENNHGYFKAKLIEVDADHLNYSPLVEIRWYRPNVILQAGQIHRFNARLKPIHGRANPGSFDRQKWSYSEHVAFKVTIKKHIETIIKKSSIRSQFYEKVQSVTNDLTNQGLLLALSFADKSLISYEDKNKIRSLGISHLFAISGLHIGLLFSAIYLLAQAFYNRLLPSSKMGWFSIRLINFTALGGAWGYAYLAGFSLPTQRAFLMLLVAVVILSLKRKCFKVDLFLLVLFVVLIWDPLAVLSVSLWLSFFAVAIILLLLWIFPFNENNNNKPLLQRESIRNSLIKYVRLLFLLQFGLTFLMLPIQLVFFSGVSLVAIMVNLIAIPLFSLAIIPMVLIASGLSLIYEPIALFIFQFCDYIITIFFYLTSFVSDSYQLFSSAVQKILIITFGLCLFVFIFHFQEKELRKISYLFVFLILCLLNLKQTDIDDSWFVEVIDVGQGLSVLVRSEDETLLYDTGARYPSGFNMVDNEVLPYLTYLGINQLDHLVISHSDNDHAGGANIIVQKIAVLQRWSGEPLNSQHHFNQCERGQHWKLGKLTIEVLSPTELTSNDNNNSCVLRISDGKKSVLLTGDIEKRQELKLIRELGEKLNSDILLAPHHGSRHSSSESFIQTVSPDWVVFSAGFLNRWGFPSDEVIRRYENQSVKMVNSGLSGLIRFQISSQDIKIKTFREDLAPYWYHHSFYP